MQTEVLQVLLVLLVPVHLMEKVNLSLKLKLLEMERRMLGLNLNQIKFPNQVQTILIFNEKTFLNFLYNNKYYYII